MAALILKNEAVKITQEEAKKLAQALHNLSKHYNMSVSPVLMAWLQVAAVSASIYGPKIMLLSMAQKQKKQQMQHVNTLMAAGQKPAQAMSVAPAENPNADPNHPRGVMKFQ